MTEFIRYNVDQWSVLYQDGEMVKCGDSYLSDGYLSKYLNVEEFENDNCFLGEEHIYEEHIYENVAKNLREILDYEKEIENAKKDSQKLKDEAENLLIQASCIENYRKIDTIISEGKFVDNGDNIWRLIVQHDNEIWRSSIFREENDFKTQEEMRVFIAKELMD